VRSETPSLLSYILRDVSFTEVGSVYGGCVARTDAPVYMCEGGGGCVHIGHAHFCSKFTVYYESMKRKLKIKPIYERRCDGRLQTKRFTRFTHTGSVVELEHLKIKTRLTNEKFASVKGDTEHECKI
jgi:hypothetical protein